MNISSSPSILNLINIAVADKEIVSGWGSAIVGLIGSLLEGGSFGG